MISRVNNNNSFYRPVDGLSPEQESARSTQAESAKPVMITEIGFPAAADAGNSPAPPESTSIAADGRNLMNMRAGLLQKSLNDALSRENVLVSQVKPNDTGDGTTTNAIEPTSVEFPNLKAEEKRP